MSVQRYSAQCAVKAMQGETLRPENTGALNKKEQYF